MLKFIEQNDFLLVDTFKENEDGSVSWVYDEGEGLPTHSGIIREGFTRTVDDEAIDVYAKMLELESSGDIAIQRITDEERAEKEQQSQIEAFKTNRQKLLDSAIVETESGNKYDANEKSIGRMANAIIAASDAGLSELPWSLADTGTGVMTTVTLADLKEAHKLSVRNMADIWGVE